MQPDQSPSPDYNFIMNSAPQKRGLFGGGSQKQRILMVIAGAGVLLVVFGVLFSLIFSGSTSNTERLVDAAAQQAEIIRIAEIGEKQATSTDAKNYASTVKLSMTSAHNQLTALLSSQGRKLSSNELNAAKDSDTDKALTTAAQTNRFNEVFTEELEKAVRAYQQDIREIFESSISRKEKEALSIIFNQTSQLNASTD